MKEKSNEPTKIKKAMKKTMRFLSMVALALVGAVMTGCSSDDNSISEPQQPETKSNVVTLTTTVSLDGDAAGTRALTGEGVKTFATGETMALVYKNTNNETVKAVSAALTESNITNEGQSATFTFTLVNPSTSENVTYIYPAAMAKDDGSVNYDALASQNGTLATLASNFDFCTKSGAWVGDNLPSLTLENQLAILAITLKNAGGSSDITSSITSLTLSDGTYTYNVSRSAAAGPIYVAIRPTSSANIDITATDGTKNYTKTLTGKTYAAGNGYSVSWRMTEAVPEGVINGKFTINADGTQVYFSKGNLQATYNDTDWTWAFAEHQWDYIGNAAGNTSIDGDGTVSANNVTVDLFGWVGASNTTWAGDLGTTGNAAMHGISNSFDGYGDNASEALKSDWGNTISDGYTWFTLSSDEWTYLFNTRTVNGGQGSGKSYTLGQSVNDKLGVVIYPDDYTSSVYAGSDWSTFEAAGCVFLPAAGFRGQASVYTAGSYGLYWSSSPYTSVVDFAYYVFFDSGSLNPAANLNRSLGGSVRLVRQVE